MGDTLTDSAVRRLADTLPRGWRAAAQFAPVAPPRIVLCYDDDIRGLVEIAAELDRQWQPCYASLAKRNMVAIA
jgi:hypothetical protein